MEGTEEKPADSEPFFLPNARFRSIIPPLKIATDFYCLPNLFPVKLIRKQELNGHDEPDTDRGAQGWQQTYRSR